MKRPLLIECYAGSAPDCQPYRRPCTVHTRQWKLDEYIRLVIYRRWGFLRLHAYGRRRGLHQARRQSEQTPDERIRYASAVTGSLNILPGYPQWQLLLYMDVRSGGSLYVCGWLLIQKPVLYNGSSVNVCASGNLLVNGAFQ